MGDVDSSAKRRAAARVLDFVEAGMTLGLGSGSTAHAFVRLLGERARDGLEVRGVPTSEATRRLAEECGVPLTRLEAVSRIDLAVDGADECSPELDLVKGGGGALVREKVVAARAERFVVVIDASKRVPRLGRFPLPLAVVPFAWKPVAERVAALGASPVLRRDASGAPFTTDDGLSIVDAAFGAIDDPPALAAGLDAIPGLVEHGLFLGMADAVVVGGDRGVEVLRGRP